VVDWGPKPFKELDSWSCDPRFVNFVEQAWETIEINGRVDFVLKEKLKALKGELRRWNKGMFWKLTSVK